MDWWVGSGVPAAVSYPLLAPTHAVSSWKSGSNLPETTHLLSGRAQGKNPLPSSKPNVITWCVQDTQLLGSQCGFMGASAEGELGPDTPLGLVASQVHACAWLQAALFPSQGLNVLIFKMSWVG